MRLCYWAAFVCHVCAGEADIARMLIMQGAKINTRNEKGENPLHIICQSAPADAVSLSRSLIKVMAVSIECRWYY